MTDKVDPKVQATIEATKKHLDDPLRHLTASEVPVVQGIAADAWREAKGDEKTANELLVWKAISVNIPLVKCQPLARAIWAKSGKNFPAPKATE